MKKAFRVLLYSKPVHALLLAFFSIFYSGRHLSGPFFDEKRMGFFWALRGLRGKLLGENKTVPWPVHPRTIVSGAEKISFHPSSLNVFQVPGCYWQCHDAEIIIGKRCHVAPNSGIITTNHDVYSPSKHARGENVIIGDECWIGMNSVILPGVHLGPHTIVAAGAAVTRSFPEGHCIVGGVSANLIRKLEHLDVNNEI